MRTTLISQLLLASSSLAYNIPTYAVSVAAASPSDVERCGPGYCRDSIVTVTSIATETVAPAAVTTVTVITSTASAVLTVATQTITSTRSNVFTTTLTSTATVLAAPVIITTTSTRTIEATSSVIIITDEPAKRDATAPAYAEPACTTRPASCSVSLVTSTITRLITHAEQYGPSTTCTKKAASASIASHPNVYSAAAGSSSSISKSPEVYSTAAIPYYPTTSARPISSCPCKAEPSCTTSTFTALSTFTVTDASISTATISTGASVTASVTASTTILADVTTTLTSIVTVSLSTVPVTTTTQTTTLTTTTTSTFIGTPTPHPCMAGPQCLEVRYGFNFVCGSRVDNINGQFPNSVYKTVTVASTMECGNGCAVEDNCEAFDYEYNAQQCRYYTSDASEINQIATGTVPDAYYDSGFYTGGCTAAARL